ncbi:hypothetical protein DEJ27_12140 [Curtobacterium sp. MCPF17_018]|nr:hypothetical protein DEJ27_12140 [Curtobacterium sp. MCPF17_018]
MALQEVIWIDAKDVRPALPWDVVVAAPDLWCERVSQGASFTLTLHGTPIALLLPPFAHDSETADELRRPISPSGG